jgi:hypothetical protein
LAENITKIKLWETLILLFLIVLATGGIFLGVLQFKKRISLSGQTGTQDNSQTLAFSSSARVQQLESLKNKDTDQDGLNDYEELFVYGTSPYLQDTDGDNYSDKEEIDSHHDPLCPSGSKCSSFNPGPMTNSENSSLSGNSGASSNQVNLDTIRQILKRSGAPPDKVDQISDEELLNLYNETVKETGISLNDFDLNALEQITNSNSTGNQNQSQNFPPLSLSSLKNLPPSEIRKLLLQSGVDENMLNQVDDQTLKAVFVQVIEEKEKSLSSPIGSSINQNINL